jgi:dipeptide/tripeptide permease
MTTAAETEKPKGGLGQFPRTFWIANVMELFERGAYYGLNALLGRYLTDKTGGALGFSEDEAGLLQSVVYALTYVLPILGGALADRYGYRRMLLVAFSFLSAGYFASGQVDGYGAVFAMLLVMATGSGLFKPIISGTIARTTNERNSGLGFGIFYWTINLGALIAPFVAGVLKGRFDWSAVFTASSLYCAAMLLPAIFLYRDPPRPQSTKTLRQVLGGALDALSDARFMLLIFVYSCFWILYFQNFGTVLWYLRDFVDPAPINAFFARLGLELAFDAEHVTMINAGTIVLLQIVVSRLAKNVRPLPTMVVGILIGSLGFLCLALSREAWVFIVGIAVFSIGEMTCHPKYLGYIGLIAPADKKANYMGYAFLYGVVGSLVGANVGGEAYSALLTPLKGSPDAGPTLRWFWLVFALLGACTMVGLLVYDRLFGKDTPETRRRARRVVMAIYLVLLAGAPALLGWVWSVKGVLPVKTAIQAGIMVLLGGGGLAMLVRRPAPTAVPPAAE